MDKFKKKSFIELTKEYLVGYKETLLAKTAFGPGKYADSKEKCILFLGMNPAGGVEESELDDKHSIYLFYFPQVDNKVFKHSVYPKYFKPIYEFADKVTDGNSAWHTYNEPFDILKKSFNTNKEIEEVYYREQNKKYKIYYGDLFYYHATKQSDFKQLINHEKCKQDDYFKRIIEKHIDELTSKNKEVVFIYINNATASNLILGDKLVTSEEYQYKGKTYHIFYGGMLSGQRAMDNYSIERLAYEIKNRIDFK